MLRRSSARAAWYQFRPRARARPPVGAFLLGDWNPGTFCQRAKLLLGPAPEANRLRTPKQSPCLYVEAEWTESASRHHPQIFDSWNHFGTFSERLQDFQPPPGSDWCR